LTVVSREVYVAFISTVPLGAVGERMGGFFYRPKLDGGLRMKRMATSFTLVPLVLVALIGLGGPAGATEPERFRDEFDFSFTNPAGVLCDFRVRLDIHVVDDSFTFVDASGSIIRIVDHNYSRITFTNVATKVSVVSIGRYTTTSYPSAGSFLRGAINRVVDSSGDLLFTVAGVIRLNKNYEEVFVTPHAASERFLDGLCGALN
jgi:hypothetical protein